MKRIFIILSTILIVTLCKGQNADTLLINPAKQFKSNKIKLEDLLKNKLIYPIAAREAGIEGTVRLGFTLKKNGNIKKIKIVKSIGYGCEKVAVCILKSFKHNLNPATRNGRPIDKYFEYEVDFKLH
jgi:TonB family protein